MAQKRRSCCQRRLIRDRRKAEVGQAGVSVVRQQITALHRKEKKEGTPTLRSPLGRLRVVSLMEGVSYLLLLGIAMPLKYLAEQPEAVQVVGSLHGALTILFVLAVAHVWLARRWSIVRVAIALIASVIPFGAFALEASLRREDQTDAPRPSTQAGSTPAPHRSQ